MTRPTPAPIPDPTGQATAALADVVMQLHRDPTALRAPAHHHAARLRAAADQLTAARKGSAPEAARGRAIATVLEATATALVRYAADGHTARLTDAIATAADEVDLGGRGRDALGLGEGGSASAGRPATDRRVRLARSPEHRPRN